MPHATFVGTMLSCVLGVPRRCLAAVHGSSAAMTRQTICPDVCRADVLAYDRSRGAHHVLYEDGEDEWLKLPCEVVSWQKGTSARSLGAGLSFGAIALWCRGLQTIE